MLSRRRELQTITYLMAKAMRAKGQLWEQPLKEGLKDWLGFPYTFYDAFNV